jgi:hypothetical protein
VFNAEKDPNGTSTRGLNFSPAGKCPAYVVQDDIAQAVAEKQRKDEFQTAELVSRGTPSVAQRKGIDGGMHALFAAKTPNGSTGHSEAKNFSVAAYSSVPSVPPSVNPPASPDAAPAAFAAAPGNYGGEYVSSGAPSSPAAASASRSESRQPATSAPVRVASAPSSGSEGFFSSLARKIGLGGSDTTASTAPAPTKQSAQKAKPVVAPVKPPASVKSSEPKVVAKPQPAEKERDTAMAGAQPVVPGNAFDSRWSLR